MAEGKLTFAVTVVRPGGALPQIEVGVYEYLAGWLPCPGDTITVSRIGGGDESAPAELQGFVTRVNPLATTPISVTIVTSQPDAPDYYAA
jgi:hypothetical protein